MKVDTFVQFADGRDPGAVDASDGDELRART